jgi:endothelin-converting enzyme/putative endopeptidase
MLKQTGFLLAVFFMIFGVSTGFAKTTKANKASKLTVPDILDASALKDGSDGKPAVDPCQDFYQFACGQWIEKTVIPADKDRVMHQSTALMDQTDENLNQVILKLEKSDPSLLTPASKQIVDYYNSCMNFDKSTPPSKSLLKANLEEINQAPDKASLFPLLAKMHLGGTGAFFSFGSGQDLKDSSSVIGFLDQGGMGLPEPTYYFEKDPKSVETRKKYVEHIAKTLQLIGQKKKVATENARIIMAFETKLAEKAMTFDDRQNPAKINHPITREALAQLAPAIGWNAYFTALSAPPSALNINEPEFFSHLSEAIEATPLKDLKTYLAWQLTNRSASEVSAELDDENFDFWYKYLHGEKEMKPQWKRCTHEVEHKLGYALAEVYVKTIDAQAIRSKIEAMITWIEQTFQNDLESISVEKGGWLDSSTKAEALKKLTKLKQKLGAPGKWRDYSSLTTEPISFYANDLKAAEFENRRDIAKIGKPLDRLEWDMMPWEINAYYDPPKNEFVFPFGILQPPSFDLKASDGANLGAFGGGTIGHELTHGFDNDGRQYDSDGNVKDWWTEATKKKFEERSQCYIHQADAYKVESVGLNVDGTKSLTENLADQGGVKLGYAALLLAQTHRPPSALWKGKYSENQQYWISYAQSWCGKARPETLRQQIKTNPHPPEEFRVNGVLMNRPEFARDFACKEGSRMAPQVRCSLW